MRKVIIVAIEVDGAVCPTIVNGENCAALIKGIEDGAVPGCVGPITVFDFQAAPPMPVEPEEFDMSALRGFQVKGVMEVRTVGQLVAVLSQFPPAMAMQRRVNFENEMAMQRRVNFENGELYIDEPC